MELALQSCSWLLMDHAAVWSFVAVFSMSTPAVALLLPVLLAVLSKSIDPDYFGSDRCPIALGGLGQTCIRGRAEAGCMREERSAGVCVAPCYLPWGMLRSHVASSRRHGLHGTVVGS